MARFIPEGRFAGPRKSWSACVGAGDQARAPAQKRRGSLSPTAARDGRDWHLVFPCDRSRPATVIPRHASVRSGSRPDEVNNPVTGLSKPRSGKRRLIPQDLSRRHCSVRISPVRRSVQHGRATVPISNSIHAVRAGIMVRGLIGAVIAGFVAVNIGVALSDHFMRKDRGLMRMVSD
jgi:hypothetical protein